MKNIKSIFGLKHNVDIFQSRESAFRCCERCIKLHIVMLGGDGKFWLASFVDAQKLFNAGYEIAK